MAVTKIIIKTERQIVTQMLEAYREFTCLWDPSDGSYNNKEIRHDALEKLQEILKTIDENTTIDCVKKRLEHMRSAYNRVRRKIQDNKRKKYKGKYGYAPTLWYFDYLTFLDGKLTTANKTESDTDDEELKEAPNKIKLSPIRRRSRTFLNSIKNRQNRTETVKSRLQCTEAPQKSHVVSYSTEEGISETYGKTIGLQLKEMSKIQRYIAEKLISDVIFYGKLEKLTPDSTINLNNNMAAVNAEYIHIQKACILPVNDENYDSTYVPQSPEEYEECDQKCN